MLMLTEGKNAPDRERDAACLCGVFECATMQTRLVRLVAEEEQAPWRQPQSEDLSADQIILVEAKRTFAPEAEYQHEGLVERPVAMGVNPVPRQVLVHKHVIESFTIASLAHQIEQTDSPPRERFSLLPWLPAEALDSASTE